MTMITDRASLDRTTALAHTLGITAEDLRDLPHKLAADQANQCIAYEHANGIPTSEDWHADFRQEADTAVSGGLKELLAYLLDTFYEVTVHELLQTRAASKPEGRPPHDHTPGIHGELP
jgi:hypothetical protein